MTNLNLKFKSVVKDQLFYGQYEFCFGFTLAEANALRGLKHDLIDSRLDQRIEWREMARKRWRSSTLNETVGWNVITVLDRENLHCFCNLLSDKNCKLIVSTHYGWVYTNDVDLINELRQIRYLTNKTYTQAKVNRPKNTILLKNSQYASRSYFYNIKLTSQEKQNLENFFSNQKENIRTSPSLTGWLYKTPYMRTHDYFFIDYTGDQWLTMLSLIRPGIIRKTMNIIQV